MADKTLSSIVGGSAEWNPNSFSGQITLSSGVSGDIITLNAPADKRIRLTGISGAFAIVETGITIVRDGVEVINSMDLTDNTPVSLSNTFFIANSGVAIGLDSNGLGLSPITGKQIVIKKDTGNTTSPILYSFETGD